MKKILYAIFTFLKKASEDSLAAYAAQVTFFVLLSFFPFLIFIILITSKLSFSSDYIINQLMDFVPSELESYVRLIVDEIEYSSTASFSSFTIVTVLVSLWSAGKGIQAMTYGLNKIYRVEKNKNYIFVRLLSALYTFVFALMLFALMIIHVFGANIVTRVIDIWPSMARTTLLIYSLKNGFTFLILFMIFLIIYYQLPGRKGRFKHELTGAAFAALAWMLMTNGFSIFIKYSARASYMYGSLTSIILIIIWLYIGMQIILYGAEINYYMSGYIEHMRNKKTQDSQIYEDTVKDVLGAVDTEKN